MQIIADRRALHEIPELDRDLPQTMAYLKNALAGLRCRVFSPIESALCAYFDFGCSSTIAFRSDADALPIQEKTDAAYASRIPGRMHACGHDGHMAMALELARRVNTKEKLPHNVLIVFQPAEETTGGARDICETGVFREHRVEAIFGMHLWPGLPEGQIASRREEMMSRSCEVNIDVWGKSSHIARSEEGLDALAAAVDLYGQITALEQSMDPSVFRLLKFGRLESGQVRNAISSHSHLEGSLRAFRDTDFFWLRDGILSAGKRVEEKTGCRVEIWMSDGYPAVLNPSDLCVRVRQAVAYTELPKPVMITEDFSWYQRELPGMFFFLGAGNAPALHADTFDFNEEILMKGADFFEELAERFQ